MILHQKIIRTLPTNSGVYLFYQNNQPIYVGKAINLKARILYHFQDAKYDSKEKIIVEKADKIKTITTSGDLSAILFEAELIKKYQPKYNVRWKDDKNFLYIKITIKDKYPKILTVRKENDGYSLYFGPFSSNRVVNNLLREIRRIVPFCNQKKLGRKPCFYSKIGLCSPCPNYILSVETHSNASLQKIHLQKIYRSNIKKIINILKGKFSPVLNSLEKELKEKIKKEEYEEALKIRNRIEWLKELIYQRSFTEEQLVSKKKEDLQKEIKELLRKFWKINKPSAIRRIECFDVSNLFGQEATGSMVVFTDGLPDKREYKRFRIKTVKQISDTEMLKEVLKRRLTHQDWPLPDVFVIDGGRPQLRAVLKTLDEFKINLPVLAIAKNPDRVIMRKDGFRTFSLPRNSSFFNLIKHIRDESHRFARKYHLLLRKKKMML